MLRTINSLSKELNISKEVVEKIYIAYWIYIKNFIEALPLQEDLTEDEFNKLRVNFNIPNLGKLICTYSHYLNIKNKKHAKHQKDKTSG